MCNIGIVVIGYNRLHCVKRLLGSLSEAIYGENKVDIIISIDKSGNKELYKYVNEFKWKFGGKKVIIKDENLGLKKHVIECGNLTEIYENIIVLEDDIYVSPYFYNYAKQAIKFYEGNTNIAGISLYKHSRNIDASKIFKNEQNQYDTFFMQYAQSWGQIWNRNEWNNFMNWYVEQNDKFEHSNKIPQNLYLWSDKSWLKYHIRYCIENNKYFVYPNVGHSTNFNNVGSHATINSPGYQVELMYGYNNYKFMEFKLGCVRYDAFFEREGLELNLNIPKNDICIDIYGKKMNREKKRYWLTTKIQDFKILKSFGLELRPHEMNVINNIEGDHIFLYDTSKYEKNNIDVREHEYHLYLYYQGECYRSDLLNYTKYKYINDIKYKLSKIKNKKFR